jgi:hypothetical protein
MGTITQIEGDFSGFDGGAVFRLANGQVWQQARYRYRYHYAYRPRVEVSRQGSGYVMQVPCMNDQIEVVPANVLCEGAIVSDFSGFDGDTIFEFQNGQRWQQAAYKYAYHYAYWPQAIVVDGIEGVVLSVEGMDETVQVRRIR